MVYRNCTQAALHRAISKIDGFSQDTDVTARQACEPLPRRSTARRGNGVTVKKAKRTPDGAYVEHKSSLTFAETVAKLVEAIEKVGMNVFARIDHAANAQEVGMELRPSVVLIYGHARGGTPVMQAAPVAALDLPLRVLIRETDCGEAMIAFHPAQTMLAPYPIPAELVDRLAKAQQLLVGAIQSGSGQE